MGGHSVEFVNYLRSNYEVVFLRCQYWENRKFANKERRAVNLYWLHRAAAAAGASTSCAWFGESPNLMAPMFIMV
jgi:hypothetical protein